MQTDVNNNETGPVLKTRRDLFLSSGKVALTAPAVALLLQASAKRAHAAQTYGVADAGGEVGADLVFVSDDGAVDDFSLVSAGDTTP